MGRTAIRRPGGTFFDGRSELAASLFLTGANEGGELVGGIRKLAAVLETGAPRGFDWHFDHLPLESHGSVPMLSTYRGLEFIFSDWALRDPLETYNRFGIEAVERFYAASEAKYGYERGAAVFNATRIAVALRDSGRLDEAMAVIHRYRDVISPPPRALIGVADEYRERGEFDRAIEVYRMTLEQRAETQSAEDDAAIERSLKALAELGDGADIGL